MSLDYISEPSDLVTSKKDTISGFKEQAELKSEKANEYVARARELEKRLSKVNTLEGVVDLANDPQFGEHILTAAGLSSKAKGHIPRDAQKEIAFTIFDKYERLEKLKESILYRYLLTEGASLSGKMRNVVGNMGENRIAEKLEEKLESIGRNVHVGRTASGNANLISWDNRTIFLNRTSKFIGKNIDMIIVKSTSRDREALKNPDLYRGCVEIKSGIDPAGADEHWKTARSALERIIKSFSKENKQPPELGFIGAAIETSMAVEIFSWLNDDKLQCAANMLHDDQLDYFVDWLVNL